MSPDKFRHLSREHNVIVSVAVFLASLSISLQETNQPSHSTCKGLRTAAADLEEATYVNLAFQPDELTLVHGNGLENCTTQETSEVQENENNTMREADLQPPKPHWDLFGIKPATERSNDSEMWITVSRVVKVITIGFCFLIILFTGVLSKLTFCLIATNLNTSVVCDCTDTCENCQAVPMHSTIFVTEYSEVKTIIWSWSLILVICFPYTVTLLRNLWKTISFTKPKWHGFKVLFTALFTEICHSVGVIILTTVVLPKLDLFHSVLIFLGLGIIPSLLRMLNKQANKKCYRVFTAFNILSLFAQLTALFAYPIAFHIFKERNFEFDGQLVGCLFGLLLMSVHWWPNYFDSDTLACSSLSKLILTGSVENSDKRMKPRPYRRLIGSSSSIVQVVVNLAKICITIIGSVTSTSISTGIPTNNFFHLPRANLSCSNSSEGCEQKIEFPSANYDDLAPIYIALVCISSALVCYYFVLHAIKSKFHPACFAAPLVLLTPVSLAIIFFAKKFPDSFQLENYPMIIFNTMEPKLFGESLNAWPHFVGVSVMFALWFLSQLVSTLHAWQKPHKTIPKTERLYLLPMFDAECIEQSLLYNRKPKRERKKPSPSSAGRVRSNTEDSECNFNSRPTERDPLAFEGLGEAYKRDPSITQIYFCATMWHETEKEMLLMLKSVLR
ncbi:chitin synthase chs-2-like [Watersipora subatra]|uniref:chitin synthase chs-2-like n=1 Tax=Watersipora subatra TaxID=2589382 RepID=UPI00355C8D03